MEFLLYYIFLLKYQTSEQLFGGPYSYQVQTFNCLNDQVLEL